jgi:peptide/nickel transport system permease protein
VRSRRALAVFLARRVGALVGVLVVMSFVIFLFLYLAPGSAEQTLLGPRQLTPAAVADVRHEYHLDRPFIEQYVAWVEGAARFDFGRSILSNEPVTTVVRRRLGLSLELAALAFVFAFVVGVPLGVVAGSRRRTSADRALVGFSVVGISAPAFATGILLLYVFAVRLNWFPVFGQGSGLLGRLWHLTLPAIALGLTGMGLLLRLTRAGTAAAIEQDYVAFARARGISRRRVLQAYVLRNALVPIITASGLILAYLVAGAVLVEVTFALPGVGSLLVDSITSKDIPVVQGVAMLIAFVVVVINLFIDLLYLAADPRIGFEAGRS